jgi:polyhydroxyalkanoate synthesis regulator phasin
MSDSSRTVLDRLRQRGEEVFTQVSNELMMNPRFIQAMQTAMRGKETVDYGITQALKTMNLPTRTEFKRALSRVDSLETEVRELRDELRRTRAQAARASVAARTATRPSAAVAEPAKATSVKAASKAAPKKKAAAKKRKSASGKSRAGSARRTSVKVQAPVTTADVIVETPDE